MSKSLYLKIPTRLIDLSAEQILFISRLYLMGYAETEFLVKAFIALSRLKITDRQPAADGAHWYTHPTRKKSFIIETDLMANMAGQCRFLLEPAEVMPIKWIKFARARHYRLYNATFEEYLMAENFYFAFIDTKKESHLDNLISVLYRRPWQRWNSDKIQTRAHIFTNVDPAIKNAVFMWYVGFRSLVPKRCPNLFTGVKSNSKFSIRNYINGMIHQLSGGNITLNEKLLKQPAWDALDEMEQRALDAARMEEIYNKK